MANRGTSDRRSDEELIEICNCGDADAAADAFNALYLRHKDFVIRVALRVVGDHDMALDVVQETFRYLLRKFPPAGRGLTLTSKLTTLLYPVAKNSAISLLRKAGRFPAGSAEPDELPAVSPPSSGNILPLLDILPAERREVILLRFVDDMSLREIAESLQIPLGTVKSRLHLAIKQLRESPEIKKDYFS